MQLNMKQDVFSDETSLSDILGLLRHVHEGRHIWIANELEIAAAERYLRRHAPPTADSYISLAQKGVVELQWIGAIEKPAEIDINAENLRELVFDLSRPAVLVVEDQASDGSFFIALCKVFGAERLLVAVLNGWLEIRHGGGSGTVPAVTTTEIGYFRHKIRVAVILDSDRLVPGEMTLAHERADSLRLLGAVVHVFELREIENYMPNRALAAVRPFRTSAFRLRFLRMLTPAQRGVYDFKFGFGPTSAPPNIPLRQVPLFAGLPLTTLMGLRGGFGKNVSSCMTLMAGSLNERDFQGIGNTVTIEITMLLQSIAGII